MSDLIQEKEETSTEMVCCFNLLASACSLHGSHEADSGVLYQVERVQRYAEKMEAAGTAFQHKFQEHASKSQVQEPTLLDRLCVRSTGAHSDLHVSY